MRTPEQWGQLTDAELVEHARSSATEEERRDAFTAIYHRYLDDVTWHCRSALREIDSALDAMQDTFAAAYEELCVKQALVAELRPWLRGIATKRCFRYMRGGAPGKGHRVGPEMLLAGDQDSVPVADITADVEDAAVKAALQADAERLVAIVAATLTARQQHIYKLSIREQVRGQALGARLGVNAAQASRLTNETADLVMKGIGALVLARAGRAYCPVLAAILDQAAWTGENFDARLRERIVRHFDTCPKCDNCQTCATKQQELGRQLIPVLIPMLFTGILHERISEAIRQAVPPAASKPGSPGDNPPAPPPLAGPHRPSRTRRRLRHRSPAAGPKPARGGAGGAKGRGVRNLLPQSPALAIAVGIAAVVVATGGGIAIPLIIGGHSHAAVSRSASAPAAAHLAAVRACTFQAAGNSPASTAAVPPSVGLPATVSLPRDAGVFGAYPGAYAAGPGYIIGPSSDACQLSGGSADGGGYAQISQPGSTAPSVGETFSPGGYSISAQVACTYIPQTNTVPGISSGSAGGCLAPSGEVITQLPANTPGLYASLVRIPENTNDSFIASSGHGYPSFAVFAAQIQSSGNQPSSIQVSETDCALPAAQQNICTASLRYFLASFFKGTGITAGRLTAMEQEIGRL